MAFSPFPYGMPFWHSTTLGGMWGAHQYEQGEHEQLLDRVLENLPADSTLRVVSHNGLVHPRLVHRWEVSPFSGPWRAADLIVLDDRRGSGVEDGFDEPAYREKKILMEQSGLFDRRDFGDGLTVWKRR